MNILVQQTDLFRFISPDELSVYCGVSANVREEHIIPNIILAQDLFLKKLLGNTLYNDLKDEFINANYIPNNLPDGTTTTNAINYKQLYAECFPALVWWTAYYSIKNLSIKITETGLMFNDTDYSENGKMEVLNLSEDRCRKIAEEYTVVLKTYLDNTFKTNGQYEEEKTEIGERFSGMYFKRKVKYPNTNIYKPF